MTMAERIARTLSVLDEKEQCYSCDGAGWIIIEGDDGIGYYAQQATCEECHGEGWVIRDEQDHDAAVNALRETVEDVIA